MRPRYPARRRAESRPLRRPCRRRAGPRARLFAAAAGPDVAARPTLSSVRAVVYDAYGEMPRVETVPDPAPAEHGAVVRVHATGLCRSDWHGWMGHDPAIVRFPHVPGHELAGVVEAVGAPGGGGGAGGPGAGAVVWAGGARRPGAARPPPGRGRPTPPR